MIHISPSILNSWTELRSANEESPPWVTPENFKDTVMGVFKPSIKASAGNACSEYLFGGFNTFTENGWKFKVDDKIKELRDCFPYGYGIPEVPAVHVLDGLYDGEQVRLSMRADYLTPWNIAELKTSSRSFSAKGKTRSYLESMQAFAYMNRWNLPITFLFVFVGIKEIDDVHHVLVKDLGHCTAYPCKESVDRLKECVSSLVPFLKSDEQMWERVTNREANEEF